MAALFFHQISRELPVVVVVFFLKINPCLKSVL